MLDKNKKEKTKDIIENFIGDEKEQNFIAEDKPKAKAKKLVILALDLGTTTGWAIKNEFGITSGSVSFKQDRFQGGGMRYLNFKRWLDQLPKIDVVYFEEVRRHHGVDAAHAYGGFLSHLTSWCEMHQIPYQGIPVGTIKKFIAGKGNASKLEVIDALRSQGYNLIDDNEADALSLLHLAVESLSSAKKIHDGVKI